jgi:amyloid beta A4 protein
LLLFFTDVVTSTSAPSTSSSTVSPVDSQSSTQTPEKPSEIPISPPNDSPLVTSIPTPDPYFTHFDPRMEHQSYKVGLDVKNIKNIHTYSDCNHCRFSYFQSVDELRRKIFFFHFSQEAQQRLEENHREKVTRVMKDWSDLEERYQDMRLADPKSAQTFKQKMTARFQVV